MSVLVVNKRNYYDVVRVSHKYVIVYLTNGWDLVPYSAIKDKEVK